jgi:hypothetical protein
VPDKTVGASLAKVPMPVNRILARDRTVANWVTEVSVQVREEPTPDKAVGALLAKVSAPFDEALASGKAIVLPVGEV